MSATPEYEAWIKKLAVEFMAFRDAIAPTVLRMCKLAAAYRRSPISTKGYKKRHARERAKFFETGKHNLKRPKGTRNA